MAAIVTWPEPAINAQRFDIPRFPIEFEDANYSEYARFQRCFWRVPTLFMMFGCSLFSTIRGTSRRAAGNYSPSSSWPSGWIGSRYCVGTYGVGDGILLRAFKSSYFETPGLFLPFMIASQLRNTPVRVSQNMFYRNVVHLDLSCSRIKSTRRSKSV